ncbi:MAG: hypothetical protein GXO76_10520 [Calditrichaeota bacterium]|nr:hypothetical protein [Calditrichota bacterium]
MLSLFFYALLIFFEKNTSISNNARNPHIFNKITQKIFPGKIQVRINDLDNNGDDEILVVSEQKTSRRSKSDQLLYYSNIQGTPNKILLLGKCKDIAIHDIFATRPGKEFLILETRNASLFLEIFGYSGQFIRKQVIFDHLANTKKIVLLGVTDWDNDGQPDVLIYIRKDLPDQKRFGVYAISLGTESRPVFQLPIGYRANIGYYEAVCKEHTASQRFFFIRPFSDSPVKKSQLICFDNQGNRLWSIKSLPGSSGFLHIADIFPKIPGKEIIMTLSGAFGKIVENHLIVINSQTGAFLQNSTFVDRLLNFIVYDGPKGKQLFLLTRDGYSYILRVRDNFLYTAKKEWIAPEYWREIKRVTINPTGASEYLILSTKRLILLDQDFKPLAGYWGAIKHLFIYHATKNAPPIFVISTERGQLNFISYSINFYYYSIRLKYFLLGILFLLVLLRLFMVSLKEEDESSWESLIGKFFTEESKIATLVFAKSGKLMKYSSSSEKLMRNYFAPFAGVHYREFFRGNLKSFANVLDEFYAGQVEHSRVSLPISIDNTDMTLQVDLQWINHPDSQTDKIALMMIQDVTELTRSHRLSAWISMAQRIAHDIKTPLSTVNLTIQRLEMALEADNDSEITKYKTYIRNMEEEINRIRRITNGFLKFVRLEKQNKLPVNLNSIIQKVYFDAQQRISGEVEIDLNLNPKIPEISGDEEQLIILLENIVDNAAHAIKGRGRITIITDTREHWDEVSQKFVSVVVVEIADTGEGMSEEVFESIFQPFFTTRKEGVGLGLIIAKEIVESHKGKITIQSKQGIGTNVTVYFPAL